MSLLLRGLLTVVLGNLLVKMMVSLGIGFLTYTGLEGFITGALGQLATAIGGLPAEVYAILARLGIFEALSIMGSAMILSATIKSVRVFLGIKK